MEGQNKLHVIALMLREMKGAVRTRGGISVGKGQQAAEDHRRTQSQSGLGWEES